MKKFLPMSLVLLALVACGSDEPPQGYFDSLTPDPASFERKRQRDLLMEAEMQQAAAVQAQPTPADQVAASLEADAASAEATDALIAGNNPTLSRSQDFAVVKEQETIESDASKLQALANDYQVIAPEPLPERTDEVNLAAYAINQTNQLGNKIYIRNSSGESGCLRYRNDPDQAQRVFLAAGGPKRDTRNLDPDGDGFACTWTPAAYRSLLQ